MFSKKCFTFILLLSFTSLLMATEDTNTTKEESALRIVPLITSSPLMGAGLGAAASYLGVANLNGGSFGEGDQSRHDDGWYSAGGIGSFYAIQQRTGVDLRLDLVTTSENEHSLHLMLNQSF